MCAEKKIAIIGSTGSIGVNALNCVDNAPEKFKVVALSSNRNVELLLKQAKKYKPGFVAVTGRELERGEKEAFAHLNISVLTGGNALVELVRHTDFDMLVNAVVGAAGFLPTLAAIDKRADIALANKETLVIGGEVVMARVKQSGVHLLPIDSEHSAIFQSLMGESMSTIEEIILTASGGPFRTTPSDEFEHITVEQALAHPNWDMGAKITIDSATMMNKGLEVIEAHWLFDVPVEKIRVLIHPQSIIHSMVAFHDGSVKAQLGVPDMKVPIQLAMTFPERVSSDFPRLDWTTLKSLTFEQPNLRKFRCLSLAFEALRTGGTAPAVLNAANEIAVAQFLQKKIRFTQIAERVQRALENHAVTINPDVETLLEADRWARSFVASLQG